MPKKKNYVVTRVPSDDWNNLMETVTLDGSFPEEIKGEIESALENMEDFSEPWIMIKVKDGMASANIFPNEELARAQVEKEKGETHQQVFLVKGQFHN
jgi:hypothetical protein